MIMAKPPGSKSAAQLSRDYIDTHPSIKDAIKLGLINYSALTRKIMQDLGISNEEAVLVAAGFAGFEITVMQDVFSGAEHHSSALEFGTLGVNFRAKRV